MNQISEECGVYQDLAHEFKCKFAAAEQMSKRIATRLVELDKEATELRRAQAILTAAAKFDGPVSR